MPLPEHDQRRQSLLFDLTTAVAVLLSALPLVTWHPAVVAHAAVMAGALVWRRSRPVTVFVVVAALAGAQLLLPAPDFTLLPHDIAVLVAMYSVVKYADPPLAGVAAGVVCLVGPLLVPWKMNERWYLALVLMLSVVVVWLLAWSMRTRRLWVDSLEDRAATAERERDHLARIAVAEERARIARELHDMVAHSLSVMIVHADGATLALDKAPERAREALRTVADTGRGALVEMRHLVTVLRSNDGTEDARTSVTTTLDRARAAGLDVRADISGDPAALPAGVELAAFRIVQESVTNALKHAGAGASATLRLAYTPAGVEVDFLDDGAGSSGSQGDAGHGLIGMRERVALYGGSITAGPDPAGGWRVTASIPVES
ncbi:sensor histidine kinase [Virgisporangium ochraceum]|uniref:sensor histidine kinase n=1 Tax=Virgisporangium ochraceum TaxID=65505 RepID=UPI0019425C54|nr:sensor histidine kinase [Virgisporangium ochraceum]